MCFGCSKEQSYRDGSFEYPQHMFCGLGAQKNHLIETVLLSTHNICFGLEIRKMIFTEAVLSGDLFHQCQCLFLL